MIHIAIINIRAAKSADYLGNVGYEVIEPRLREISCTSVPRYENELARFRRESYKTYGIFAVLGGEYNLALLAAAGSIVGCALLSYEFQGYEVYEAIGGAVAFIYVSVANSLLLVLSIAFRVRIGLWYLSISGRA